jgi:hypothetical protein
VSYLNRKKRHSPFGCEDEVKNHDKVLITFYVELDDYVEEQKK